MDKIPIRSLLAGIHQGKTIYRTLINSEVQKHVTLLGTVIDLGSGAHPSYWHFIEPSGADTRILKCDLLPEYRPDILGSLEADLPLREAGVDRVLLFNVLEHIYHHQLLVSEIRRILRPGGVLYASVPFLVRIHADPYDFYRYSESTMRKLLQEAGFDELDIRPFGGVFLAAGSIVNLALRLRTFQMMNTLLCLLLDRIVDRAMGCRWNRTTYPLGYFIVARVHAHGSAPLETREEADGSFQPQPARAGDGQVSLTASG